jgi:diketogulonate reductase-like aldo/keto reductase
VQTRAFGSTGIDVPTIGIGTWQMERDDARAAVAAIKRAIERGLTHVDTAEMYGNGRCEQLVAEAIEGQRDRVFLASKVLPRNASYNGTIRACEQSLARLKVEQLDLYMLHWAGEHPLVETFRAFEQLRADGKIKHWGVSNFDDDELQNAISVARSVGGVVACNQVLYHLGQRDIEHTVIPLCNEHGIAPVGYSPFGSRGRFVAKPIEALAKQLGRTPRQLALAYLSRKTFVIPKSSSPAHVDELADAGDLVLDDASITSIEASFPLGPWKGLPSI